MHDRSSAVSASVSALVGVLGFPFGTFVHLLPVSELFSFVPLDRLNYTRHFCVIQ